MSAPLLYFEVDPPSALAGVVLAYWGFEVRADAPATHTLWPDAGVSVVWGMYQGHTIVLGAMGARTDPVTVPVQPGVAFRGIRFWPDAAGPLCGIDPRCARDSRLSLDAMGALGERLMLATRQATSLSDAFAIFEAAIRPCLSSGKEVDTLVRQALVMIDAAPDRAMSAVARELGVSDRHLRRRFASRRDSLPRSTHAYAGSGRRWGA